LLRTAAAYISAIVVGEICVPLLIVVGMSTEALGSAAISKIVLFHPGKFLSIDFFTWLLGIGCMSTTTLTTFRGGSGCEIIRRSCRTTKN